MDALTAIKELKKKRSVIDEQISNFMSLIDLQKDLISQSGLNGITVKRVKDADRRGGYSKTMEMVKPYAKMSHPNAIFSYLNEKGKPVHIDRIACDLFGVSPASKGKLRKARQRIKTAITSERAKFKHHGSPRSGLWGAR